MKARLETLLVMLLFLSCLAVGQADAHTLPSEVADPVGIDTARSDHQGVPLMAANDVTDEEDVFDEDEDWDDFDEDFGDEVDVTIADPLYYWNTAMFHFNDKLYFWLLKPVARGYRAVLPEFARIGVKNFFYNLTFPIRFVGSILQGNGYRAHAEFARFMFNTTFGVLGFGNPAKNVPGMNPPEEDIGQAFGKWGVGEGLYLVWPFLGPSTARDSVGFVCGSFLNPVSYVDPTRDALAIRATDVVNNTSLKIGDYEALKEAAINPYTSLRDAYVQNRRKKVAD